MTAPVSYTCPRCKRTSHNPNDEAQRYCGACHRFEEYTLHQFVVYSGPKDYPQVPFVVRRFEIRAWEILPREAWAAQTLDAARSLIPEGMVLLGREPGDEPHIVEVWT
jgi:hypothetical protein